MSAASDWTRPSPIEWIALAAGLVLTLHYAWILDDAYVYFRYVDNWVWLDNGLVYNRGEYVEGFTSPFWTLLLGALRLSGLDYWILVRGIGLASFAAFWALMVALNRRLSPEGAPTVAAPLLMITFSYAAIGYFTSGTETPFVMLAAPLFALFVLAPGSRPLQAAVGLAPLVRPELALVAAAGLGWSWWRTRRIPWVLALVAASTSGGWLAFRVVYYAELVPNTFHLKNASDFAQGLRYLADTLIPWGGPLAVLAAAGVLLSRRAPGRLPAGIERGVMLAVAALVALYVVRIGGDARHFRYLIFPFVLAACAASGIAETALEQWVSIPRRSWAAAGVAIAVALGTFASYPRQLDAHPLRGRVDFALSDGIVDAMHHRHHERLPGLDPWSLDSALTEVASAVASARGGATEYRGPRAELICWFHYREILDHRAIHTLGLTEPFLARIDPGPSPGDRPAHRWGLIPLGRDLRRVQQRWGRPPERGMLRADVASGEAPAWIAENLERLELIERRAYNRHDLAENLELALTHPPRIRVGPIERDPAPAPATSTAE